MIKKVISGFLLTLFLGFYTSITLFTHTHIINGVTIVHSHPYSTGVPGKPFNHQHSDKQIGLLQLLSHFSSGIAPVFLSLCIAFSLLYKILINPDERNHTESDGKYIYSLRAPPAL